MLATRVHIAKRLRRARLYTQWVRSAPAVWCGVCVLPLAWVELVGLPVGAAPFEEAVRNAGLPILLAGVVAISWVQPALLRSPRPWFQKERWRFAASVVVMFGALVALALLALNGGRWPSPGAQP